MSLEVAVFGKNIFYDNKLSEHLRQSLLCFVFLAQVMDASGKLPNGIFSGTSAVFGNFDQCLSIVVGNQDDGGFR